VYAKQRSRTDGPYGYRVRIDPTGNRALKNCLPPELFETFLATCARAPRYFNVLTEKKRAAAIPLRGDADEINSERSVSRQTLRQLLLTGLEEQVSFDTEVTHYEQRPDGTVAAFFADGSLVTGDVLVAADEAHSAVRAQYLPRAVLKPAGIITIGAKVPMSPRHWNYFRRSPSGDGPWSSPQGLHVHLARDGVQLGPAVRHQEHRRRERRRPAESLARHAIRQHQGLHLLRAVGLGGQVPAWKNSNVTLVGDAIHTMTPGQGAGANTSLRDAMLLRRALTSVQTGASDLSAPSPPTRPR
jgi:2-polyprenyl-6-methoxyphenol hydroxylase-like FAD-dependent oxidoreductase